MDEVRQLGEMLKQYALSEEHKKQLFETQCSHWTQGINALYERIEQWLQPLHEEGLVEISREPYLAANASFPAPLSPFASHKLSITLALRSVEFVPEVMGAKGVISLAVMGLTSDRYGSISLVCTPPSADWQWRKDRGAKEAETHALTADYLAQQLQALIPRPHRD